MTGFQHRVTQILPADRQIRKNAALGRMNAKWIRPRRIPRGVSLVFQSLSALRQQPMSQFLRPVRRFPGVGPVGSVGYQRLPLHQIVTMRCQ